MYLIDELNPTSEEISKFLEYDYVELLNLIVHVGDSYTEGVPHLPALLARVKDLLKDYAAQYGYENISGYLSQKQFNMVSIIFKSSPESTLILFS